MVFVVFSFVFLLFAPHIQKEKQMRAFIFILSFLITFPALAQDAGVKSYEEIVAERKIDLIRLRNENRNMKESQEICANALKAYEQIMKNIAKINGDINRVSEHRLGTIDQKFQGELETLKAKLEKDKTAALSDANQAGDRLKRSQIELRFVLSELEAIEATQREEAVSGRDSLTQRLETFSIGTGKAVLVDHKEETTPKLPKEFEGCFPDRVDK